MKNLPSRVGLSHAFTKEFSIFYHQRKGHKIIELIALRLSSFLYVWKTYVFSHAVTFGSLLSDVVLVWSSNSNFWLSSSVHVWKTHKFLHAVNFGCLLIRMYLSYKTLPDYLHFGYMIFFSFTIASVALDDPPKTYGLD